ncbi:hypothetical protein SDC9_62111 [bioreactor metagenome]|uniref:Copper amine oxidase-like N-terminal domain-containing protein n=1 Tax=bioreactor metagenome TaxID=1076179 RepID=A0A644XI35_9ZZZZ
MKKLIITILTCIMLTSTVQAQDISISINGEKLNTSAVIIDYNTYVPLRTVFEKLGYEVSWDDQTDTAHIQNSVQKIQLSTNSENILVTKNSGNTYKDFLYSPTVTIDDTIYVPIQFVEERSDYIFNWRESANTVDINNTEINVKLLKELAAKSAEAGDTKYEIAYQTVTKKDGDKTCYVVASFYYWPFGVSRGVVFEYTPSTDGSLEDLCNKL